MPGDLGSGIEKECLSERIARLRFIPRKEIHLAEIKICIGRRRAANFHQVGTDGIRVLPFHCINISEREPAFGEIGIEAEHFPCACERLVGEIKPARIELREIIGDKRVL